jgi:hypothetical protein
MDGTYWTIIGTCLAMLIMLVCMLVFDESLKSFRYKGRLLQARFREIGNPAGKTRREIVALVGAPTKVRPLPEGKTALHWIARGYDIVLQFAGSGDEAVCEGASYETAAEWVKSTG